MTDARMRAPSTIRPMIAGALAVARRIGQASTELLVPPVCALCRSRIGSADALCSDCWRSIDFIRPPLCDRLGIPLPYGTGETMVSAGAFANPPDFDRARAVATFGHAMRDLIHAFKYADQHHSRSLFGSWLVLAGAELLADADLVMAVPLHPWRLISRRFNQSAILAREVARRSGRPLDLASLVRRKRTPPQVGRTSEQRRASMAGAFRVRPDRAHMIADRDIVLIDDVITTGATVNACARTLKRAGAGRVDVLALALVTGDSGIS